MNYFNKSTYLSLSSLFTLILAAYIAYLQDLIGMENVAIAVTVSVILSLIAILIYAFYSNSNIEESFLKKIGILENFIEANGMGDIINEETLSILEKNSETIWIVTSDLANDIGLDNDHKIDTRIINTVKSNLKHGKKYTYFVPDSGQITGRIRQYLRSHGEHIAPEQVKICYIPTEDFHFTSELALYDTEHEEASGVQWFPNKNLNYYIKLDHHHRMNIEGVLSTLLENHGSEDILK